MKKQEMVTELTIMIEKMDFLIKKANVKENILQMMDSFDDIPRNEVKKAYNWLRGIYNNEWSVAFRIRNLQDERIWQRMEDRDETDQPEAKLMSDAFLLLRKALQSAKRPPLFKKAYRDRIAKKEQEV